MSCEWEVWCLDCNEWLAGYGWNHQERECWSLIRMAPALADLALAAGVEKQHVYIETLNLKKIDVGPFANHKGHNLVPKNEYGQWADQCPERFKCSAGCWHDCQLKVNHEGLHGPKTT